jgi:predicted AlkP superfamily pyrophosphatase or phosphodiesterase
MTRRLLLLATLAAVSFAAPPAKKSPKLLLVVVVDQFRYDYLTRFGPEYKAGLARLLHEGAVFTNANYEHFPTVTAIGHSTVLTGATPSVSGIVGNEWFDRETGKNVTSVSDDDTKLLGAPGDKRGASPRRLLVSTVADEIKLAARGTTRTIGISAKDRAAILPVGRMADGAFWFDASSGSFVSSTYYFKTMPEWATTFNGSHVADRWLGKQWTVPGDSGKVLRKLDPAPGRNYYDALERTPFHDELLEAFAEAAIDAEQLGRHDGTDVLSVSFSATDRIGHGVGPHAEEMHSLALWTDQTIGRLLKYAEDKAGAGNVVVAFTADHGVAPLPEYLHERNMPGGRIPEQTVLGTLQNALVQRYGEGKWVAGYSGPAPYLNLELIHQKKLSYEEVQEFAADVLRSVSHIFRVYTRQQLMFGGVLNDMVDRRVRAGFNTERSPDLSVVIDPYWLFETGGTSHGTPWNYDTHVPLIVMGPGFKAGRYNQEVAINDLAPTLATYLDVQTPSGSSGRVLLEAMEK